MMVDGLITWWIAMKHITMINFIVHEPIIGTYLSIASSPPNDKARATSIVTEAVDDEVTAKALDSIREDELEPIAHCFSSWMTGLKSFNTDRKESIVSIWILIPTKDSFNPED